MGDSLRPHRVRESPVPSSFAEGLFVEAMAPEGRIARSALPYTGYHKGAQLSS
jgi:hypothetical protein